MNLRLITVVFSVLFLCASGFAQKPKKIKRKNVADVIENTPAGEILKGDETFELRGLALGQSLEHYLNAYKTDSVNPLLNYKIGVCYLGTINKILSINYLEKAMKMEPNVSTDIHYLLGQAYQLNLSWDDAIREFEIYQKSLSDSVAKGVFSNQKSKLQKQVAKHIQECNTGKFLVAHPVDVVIENLGPLVNSQYPEFSPFVTADETKLFYTARRDNTTGGGIDDNDYYYEDILVSEKVNGKWETPKNLGPPVNSDGHEGTGGLQADGKRLFVYCGDLNGGDLFETKLKGFHWSPLSSLGKNVDTKFHESSICITSDQKMIYFESDRPDLSMGGRDIFRSRLDANGEWGPPENLGPVINTEYDEDGVFLYADDKTLFFSSKGHETMGGYDIFWSKYNDSTATWSKPVNLGYPINSPDDDVFFVLSESGEHGYYSAVKNEGYGEKDIYIIYFLGGERKNLVNKPCVTVNSVVLMKGRVRDAVTMEPIEATVEISDNEKNITISKSLSDKETGKFLITLPFEKNFGLYASAPGYLFHSENFNIPVMTEYKEIVKEVYLEKIQEGKKIVLKNIFYDFDKATLRPQSLYELGKLLKFMNDEPNVKVEIGSHTDSKGSDQYNVVLSKARAKSVTDWLTEHGIAQNRMVAKGYGEKEPAAPNTKPDGSDDPEGRQLNRRTEFKILGLGK